MSFFAAAVATLVGGRSLVDHGPEVEPHELGQNLRLLLVMALAESFLLNVGPVAVSLLSEFDGEPGRFLNGLVLARIPLMLFQAVKISILPSRTRMFANGEIAQLADSTRRLALAVGAFGLATVAGSALLGPLAVRHSLRRRNQHTRHGTAQYGQRSLDARHLVLSHAGRQ